MNTYFSPSRKGLFNLPVGDAVLLDDLLAESIRAAMTEGQVLDVDAEGNPITVPAPAPEVYDPEAAYRALPIAERLAVRLNRLNEDYDQAVNVLNSAYPNSETHTWTLQVTEARDYQKWINEGSQGTAPETPFLTKLNAGRTAKGVGEGMEDLVARVLANDSIYSPILADFTSTRHGAEKELTEAAAVQNDELFEAVTWNFEVSLPEA